MKTTVVDCFACQQCSFYGDECKGGKVACTKCGELFPRCHLDKDGVCEWCPKEVRCDQD